MADGKRSTVPRSSHRKPPPNEVTLVIEHLAGEGEKSKSQPTPEGWDVERTKPPNDIERELRARSVWSSLGVIAATSLAMMANIANSVSPSIALPTIQRELGVDQVAMVWIMSAYPLSGGCLLLMFGRLADLHGRKKMFIFGSVWLIAFTIGCGFANNAVTLSILRGIQGVGASATIPASLGILAETFPPSLWRSVAFASFAAGAPIGAAFGTALGGVLTQVTPTSWRAVFWLSTGLSALSLLLGILAIDRDGPSNERDRRVDWIGSLLSTIGLTLIVFVLGQGEEARPKQWGEVYIITLLVVGVFVLVVFLLWQRFLEQIQDGKRPYPANKWIPTPPPLMRLSLWTRAKGRIAVVMAIQFFLSCGFLGWQYWTMLFYQNFVGLDAIGTVIRLVPCFVSGVICNIIVIITVSRLPLVFLMAFGTLSSAIAALLFAIIKPEVTYWAYGFPGAVFSVVGADFVMSAGTLFIAKVSLPHEQSVAGAVFQCMQQLGASIGITVGTVVFNRLIEQNTRRVEGQEEIPREVLLESYRAAQWTNFAFATLAAVLAIIFLQGVGIVGHPPMKHEHIRTMTREEIESLHLPSSSAHPYAGALGALIPAGELDHLSETASVIPVRRRSARSRHTISLFEYTADGDEESGVKGKGSRIRGKTEALLTALEEEQQKAHKLREENADLCARIAELEKPLSRKRDTKDFLRDENGELKERLSKIEEELRRMDDMLDDGMDRLRVSRIASSTREVKWSTQERSGRSTSAEVDIGQTSRVSEAFGSPPEVVISCHAKSISHATRNSFLLL